MIQGRPLQVGVLPPSRVLVSIAAVSLGIALSMPAALRGQAPVTGRVVDATTGSPLVNVRASLRLGGVTLTSTATGRDGVFHLEASRADVVVIEAMGMRRQTITLGGVGSSIDLGDVQLEPEPIELVGIHAEGESACGVPGELLREGLARLDGARPYFGAIARNDGLATYGYVMEIVRTVRRKRPVGPRYEWVPDSTTVQLEASLRSSEPSRLSSEGFALALRDSTTTYLPPTPAWLGSDAFLVEYCVASVQSDQGRGFRFWPKEDGRRVGIRGVVAVDGEGAPKSVEFTYTSLKAFVELHEVPRLVREFEASLESMQRVPLRKFDLDASDFGGSLTFSEIAPGTRMTVAWEVRGVGLAYFALWERGELKEFRPRPRPLTTSAQLRALVPVGRW